MGFYFSGHLFDEVASEVNQFVKRKIDDLMDSREPQLLAGIVNDFRVINGQRGKLGLFKLDDKSAQIDATVDDALMQANKNLFKDDELIIVMGVIQQDRFSGGANRLKVNQVWDLPSARCRFGKHLLLSLLNTTPDFERLMREFPQQKIQADQGEVRRGMSVRIALQRKAPIGNVNAQLQLGDDARFYPSDAALASWTALAGLGKAQIVYD
jgi:DNA polymerase-3 subunit alpha